MQKLQGWVITTAIIQMWWCVFVPSASTAGSWYGAPCSCCSHLTKSSEWNKPALTSISHQPPVSLFTSLSLFLYLSLLSLHWLRGRGQWCWPVFVFQVSSSVSTWTESRMISTVTRRKTLKASRTVYQDQTTNNLLFLTFLKNQNKIIRFWFNTDRQTGATFKTSFHFSEFKMTSQNTELFYLLGH